MMNDDNDGGVWYQLIFCHFVWHFVPTVLLRNFWPARWPPVGCQMAIIAPFCLSFHYFHFSKLAPLSKQFLLSSVIPQLCCHIGQAKHSEQRTHHHGNADWRQTLLMCSVQSLLWNDKTPQKAHAAAWWKEDPQLQPVWLLNHQSWSSENPQAGSQWRKAFCLQTV